MNDDVVSKLLDVVCGDCLKNQPNHYQDEHGQFLFCPDRGVLVILRGNTVLAWEQVSDAMFIAVVRQAKQQADLAAAVRQAKLN